MKARVAATIAPSRTREPGAPSRKANPLRSKAAHPIRVIPTKEASRRSGDVVSPEPRFLADARNDTPLQESSEGTATITAVTYGLATVGVLRVDALALTPQPPSPVGHGRGGLSDRGDTQDRGRVEQDPTHLATLLDRTMAGPAAPLPYRSELERRLGHSLGDIAVHHGPEARAALAALEARAATRGRHILFAESAPALATVAHEVIHALQDRGGAGDATPRVTRQDVPAEAEAERLAATIANPEYRPDAPLPVAGELPAGAVALQRSAVADPAAGGVAVAERPQDAFAEATTEQGIATPEPRVAATPTAPMETAAPGEAAPSAAAETAAAEPATAFELPPAPAPGVNPEDVAAREAAIAEAEAILAAARDVDGLMDAFAAAPPTVKAREQGQLGQRMNELTQQETQQFQEELPEVHAELNAQQEPVAPLTVEAPPPTAVTLEETPPGPAPEPEIPETPELGSFDANDGVARGLNYGLTEEPTARAGQIGESLKDVQTTDPETPRTSGPPPAIPLGGETDPQRIADQTSEGLGQARGAGDEARAAVLNGPGPEQAQPRQMDETYAVGELAQPQVAALAPTEGAQSYLTMGLPPEVQTAFDQEQQAAMQASMAGASSDVSAATETRDTARETAVNDAQTEADRLSKDADQKQRDQVTATRETIQQERQGTLDAQTKAVTDLETSTETRRQTDREAIDTRVRDDQEAIDGRYRTADTEVAAKVAGGERDAAEERRKAERDAEDQSWWDRAVSFVRDAFNALVSAIDAVFAAVRSAVNGILDAVKSFAIGLIDAAANFIKKAIAVFGEFLKGAIDALLGDIFPELAAKLNAAIDTAVAAAQSAVDVVANGLKSAVSALVDGLKAGINKILDIYQAALNLAAGLVQAALTGDWSALARKLLEAVLKVAGIAPETFYGFIGRAEDTFQLILDSPGKFVGNLLDAFIGGVRRFADNFLTHLQAGLIGWLTGALGSGGIVIPQQFDLMGVLDLARQILGLTWERLRAKAVKLVGEKNVARVEFVASYIQDLVVKGWSALWERISADVAALREMVLGGIQSFLMERVVLAAITKIASLFNPVGAIVQLVLATWNLYTFLRDQFQRIAQVVQTVVEAIANIARGILEPATARMETVLAGLLPLAIDLLARLLGLGNVGAKVREIIEKVQGFVDRAIDKLLNRVLAMFRGGKGDEAKAAAPAQPATGTVEVSKPLVLPEERHTISARIQADDVVLNIASARRGHLIEVLDAAIKVAKDRLQAAKSPKDRAEAAELITALGKARDEATEREIERTWILEGRRGLFQQFVEVRISHLIELIKAAFQHASIKSLEALFKPEGVSGPRFLPVAFRGSNFIRRHFYEALQTWRTFRDPIVAAERRTIADEVEKANANSDFNAWHALETAHRIPDDARLGTFQRSHVFQTAYELDHINPVSRHWNKTGFSANDAERDRFYFDTGVAIGSSSSNFQVVTAAFNRAKGGELYADYVEPNFTSMFAGAGTPGAKDLVDRGGRRLPFLDVNKKPLT